ncbi:DgyrCDS829 [Dimorphilus gyrociliatus]|uniref:DgyrCDS829 n=1 Tax=Dimorphilus gyrociliatus TaxID=2664684 RepID=A0A7I8VAB6_9ANNE|nr:DgyrCDS829 [Dimorphilus gyrociliatus]
MLIDNDANVEAKDNEGTTSLHVALSTNWNGGKSRLQMSFLKRLCAASKNKTTFVNVRNSLGKTALHLAFEHFPYIPLPAVVRELIKYGANVNILCSHFKTVTSALHIACAKTLNDVKVQDAYKKAAEVLIKTGTFVNLEDSQMNSPLHLVADSKNGVLAEYLIDLEEIDLKVTDADFRTPLLRASASGHDRMIVKILSKSVQFLKDRDKFGRNPLHLSCENGHLSTTQLLFECLKNHSMEMELTSVDKFGRNCLLTAAKNGHLEIVNFLAKVSDLKLDVSQQDEQLNTALHHAALNNHLNICSEYSISCYHKNEDFDTPLHIACAKGHLEIVKTFLNQCPLIVNDRNFDGWSPLHFAASNGFSDIVELLIDSNADVNIKEKLGLKTPLHIACEKGRIEVVECLLQRGAEADAKDSKGDNCLDYCYKNNYESCAILIVNSKNWRKSIRSMKNLIEYMPNVAELVLNQCITIEVYKDDDSQLRNKKFIEFDYELINKDKKKLDHPLYAIAKSENETLLNHPLTSVMMIGEMDFGDLFEMESHRNFTSYIIFVIFLILMAIIVMNLLTGLAVDDVNALRKKAVARKLSLQIDLALGIEESLPKFIKKKQQIKSERFFFDRKETWSTKLFDGLSGLKGIINAGKELCRKGYLLSCYS